MAKKIEALLVEFPYAGSSRNTLAGTFGGFPWGLARAGDERAGGSPMLGYGRPDVVNLDIANAVAAGREGSHFVHRALGGGSVDSYWVLESTPSAEVAAHVGCHILFLDRLVGNHLYPDYAPYRGSFQYCSGRYVQTVMTRGEGG